MIDRPALLWFDAGSSVVTPVAPPSEQRSSPRQEPRRRLWCRLTAADFGGAYWAEVRDVSAGGVGLRVARPLDPGTPCSLWPLAAGARPIPLTVAHRRAVRGGYFLGCAFDRPLTAAELTALLAGPAAE